VLLHGTSDSPFATLTVTDAAMPPALAWDFCFKPTEPHDEVTLSLSGTSDRVLKPARGELLGTLRHVTFASTGASPTLKVKPSGGQPGLCGVTIETDPRTQPGVVLDTLGINGARLTTPLAWDEAAWVAELARRPPLLTVIEYGTNEASDHTIVADRYVDNLRKVMARVHKASPGCDCLVLGPTDRNDTPERTPMVRDALRKAAQASGCRFWDTYEVMGGQGSIARWRIESPPRAGPDGVHLHPRGYKYLGDLLAKDVLAGYQP
jgi:lysophospholipase L1-like esterase